MRRETVASLGKLLCVAGAAIGGTMLFGVVTHAAGMLTLVPRKPPITGNAALCLLLLGISGALRRDVDARPARKIAAIVMSVLVIGLSLGTLAEYALEVDLGIDVLLARDEGPHPGRPSPLTVLATASVAAALLAFDTRPRARVRPSEWLVLLAWVSAFTALLGLVFGVGVLYQTRGSPVIGVALPTSIGLLLISTGLLFERPAGGVMRIATSVGAGGALLRRMVPATILLPPLSGYAVKLVASWLDLSDVPLVIAAVAACTTLGSLLLVAITAAPLDRAHRELEAARARTRELIEQAPDGIVLADLSGRYVDANSAACRLLGCSREELLTKGISDLVLPEEQERLRTHKARLLTGVTEVSDWTLRRKDGTHAPMEVSAKILPDGRWQAFLRDISERKRLETELRLAEARSTGILAISADAIISIDERGRITMFNQGAENTFGYTQAEVLGQPIRTLIPERLRAGHQQYIETFARGPAVSARMSAHGAEIVGLRKNGEEFPADGAISKLEVGGKRILTVALRDMTEQRRVEQEQRFLAEVGEELASTLDYEETLGNVAALAVREFADLCVVDVVENDVMRRLQVATRDPTKRWICERLAQPPPKSERSRLVWLALEWRRPILTHRISPEILQSLASNEEELEMLRALELNSLISVPLIAHGKLLGAIGFASWTASRHYGPADLEFAEELAYRAALSIENAQLYESARQALALRDEVLGVVAHDLRNPLSTIALQAQLLARRGDQPERRSQKPVEAIRRAAARMDRLIQDLLDVSRMESGRFSVEPTRLRASAIIEDSLEGQRALASAGEVELRSEIAVEAAEVLADRDRLAQIFENLIGNALRFTPPLGRVTVGAAPRHGEVLFWVADTGTGIAAEELPRVFDRFWQGRKNGRGGAGLGLAIVKGIVEAHGGHVWVESTPGRGTTFFFTIPTAPRAEEAHPADAPH